MALLRSTLEDAGHRVLEPDPGLDPVERFRREPLPVVIVDLFAKGQAGLRVALTIRREFPKVHLVGISRIWTVWNLNTFIAPPSGGIGDGVAQPFGAEALLDAVRRAEQC